MAGSTGTLNAAQIAFGAGTGIINFNQTNAFTFTNAGWQAGEKPTRSSISAARISARATSPSPTGGDFDGTFAFHGNSLEFTVAVVPEPSTYALIGLGLLALAMRRRMRMG